MAFGTDAGPGDRIAWVTDIGWMMGPWLIYGALLRGAAMALYDGAPDFPGPGRLWEFCARHKVGILGVSPSLIRALADKGDAWPASQDLSSLRILASTGEPWNPGPWRWLFEKVGKGRLPIINYSGGTEISGGILMGNPLLPIKPCSFPAPCPGIAADVADPADEGGGRSLRGAVGELVIRKPWIGMARGFRGDPERYLAAYWSRWKDVWVHGDWARIDSDGHWYILGRSDDTLKVAGKRVGPAEVESALAGHPAVAEAAVVGVPDERKGQAMIAFCVPAVGGSGGSQAGLGGGGVPEMSIGAAPGVHGKSAGAGGSAAGAGVGVLPGAAIWAASLAEELKARVAAELGKPLQPEAVHFVPALPRTRNAKVMRRIIRAVYLGEDPGDVTALENPEAMEPIRAAGQSKKGGGP
jgi:acetyl-CoA synthetase